jgi:hypothetical protein
MTECKIGTWTLIRLLRSGNRDKKIHFKEKLSFIEKALTLPFGCERNSVRGRKMIQEFKDFIAKGNVMDMAVGIIIGAAFTAIVTSLVDDLINPIISLFMGTCSIINSLIENSSF